jgi:ankyrin repeat protein
MQPSETEPNALQQRKLFDLLASQDTLDESLSNVKGVLLDVVYDGHTPLTFACLKNNAIGCSQLIEHGASVEFRNSDDRTPLMVASQYGRTQIISILLSSGCDPNSASESGWTALMSAATEGHTSSVQILLENKANIHVCTATGKSALTCCLARGGGDFVGVSSLLVNAGARISDIPESYVSTMIPVLISSDNSDKLLFLLGHPCLSLPGCVTSLLYAAIVARAVNIMQVLLSHGADVHLQGESVLPLIKACEYGDLPMVEMLLQYDANPDAIQRETTPLFTAIEKNHVHVVEPLLQARADVNMVVSYDTPLSRAAVKGNVDIVDTLLKYGANVDFKAHDLTTPLHYACMYGHLPVIQSLLRARANVHALDSFGMTPIMTAFDFYNSLDTDTIITMLKSLINAGSRVKAKDNRSITVLSHAADGRHVDAVEYMLTTIAKSSINVRDDDGATPLMVAVRAPASPEMVRALLSAGAKVNIRDSTKATALIVACRQTSVDSKKNEIIQLLLDSKADVHVKESQRGQTALHTMLSHKHTSIPALKMLISAGARVDVPDMFGTTSLMLSVKHDDPALVAALIEAVAEHAEVYACTGSKPGWLRRTVNRLFGRGG